MGQTVTQFRKSHAGNHRASAGHDVRQWLAAKSSRLFADWTIPADDINKELEQALTPVRQRARELEQNNDLARRYLQLVEIHTIGPNGMRLQVRGRLTNGRPDTRGNQRIETAFSAWGRKGSCEITGRYSWRDVERLVVRTVARDGECLLRLHKVGRSINTDAFAVEVINPQMLDHTHEGKRQNGNRIILGVEVDGNSRPVAYYLRKGSDAQKHERVPAGQMLHIYRPDRPEQQRGMTWMASAMVTMHMLERYQESAIVAAREGANKMGFFTSQDGGMDGIASEESPGEFYSESEAGVLGVIPAGYTFQSYDPTYPHDLYETFMRANLRTIAQALNVSYHALTGDLTAVNFSSIRAGTLEDREHWMVVQDWLRTNLHEPVYLRWLESYAPLNDVNGERYQAHAWQGRRWPWVDPLKDIQAAVAAIDAGLKSPQRVAAEMGVDVEEILDEIARFNEMAAEKGVRIGSSASAPPDTGDVNAQAN